MKTYSEMFEHLKSRGMDPSLYQLGVDMNENIYTFFLYNPSGQLVGYQNYRPDKDTKKSNDPKEGRYFTYLPRGVDGFFGLEQIDDTKRTIYIVEGVFKAAKLHSLGYNSITALSSNPKRLKSYFKIMRQTWNLIAIGDNDPAGQLLVNCVKKGFQSPVDIDEMADEDIIKLLEDFN